MSSEPLLRGSGGAGDLSSPVAASSAGTTTGGNDNVSSTPPKMSCCRLPVVLDLTGERVRSRWLSVIIFIQVMTVLGVLVFTAVLKDSVTAGRVSNLVMSNRPASSVGIGRYAAQPLRVRITNEKGFGAENVAAAITLLGVSPTGAAADICADYVFGDPSVIRPQNMHGSLVTDICEPKFEGTTGSTDLDGVIEFAQFRLVRGPPGIYAMRVQATNTILQADVMYDFVSEINGVTCANTDQYDIDRLGFTLGQPLPIAPVMRVTAVRGRSLANRVVIAFAVSRIQQINPYMIPKGNEVQYRNMVGPDKAAAFAPGTTMVTTNATGYATFDTLAIIGATSSGALPGDPLQVIIAFYCDGYTSLLWIKPKRDAGAILFAPVLKAVAPPDVISVAAHTNDQSVLTVEEGTWFSHDVHVLTRQGTSSKGKIVWAMINGVNGVPVSGITSYIGDASSKNIMQAQSQPITDDGRVSFPSLQFSLTGDIGLYNLTYVCEGIVSRPYLINVTSTVTTVRIVASEGWPSSMKAMETMLEKLPRIFVTARQPTHAAAQTIELLDRTGQHQLNWTAEPTDANGVTFITSLRVIPVCSKILPWNASDAATGCPEITHVNISARVDGVLSDSYITIQVNNSAVDFYRLVLDNSPQQLDEATREMDAYFAPRAMYISWITPPPLVAHAYFPINATLRVVSGLGRSVPGVTVCPLIAPPTVAPHLMFASTISNASPDPCVKTDIDGYVMLQWYARMGYNAQHRLYAQVRNPDVESWIPANGYFIQLSWVYSTITTVSTRSYSTGLQMVTLPKVTYEPNEWINFTLSETFEWRMPAETIADFLTRPGWSPHQFVPDPEVVMVTEPNDDLVSTINYAMRISTGFAGLYEFVIREDDDGAMLSPLLRLHIQSSVTQIRWAPESMAWSQRSHEVYLGAAHPFSLSANLSMNLLLLDKNGVGVAGHIVVGVLQESDGSDTRGVLTDSVSSVSDANGRVSIPYMSLLAGYPSTTYKITFLLLSNEVLPLEYTEVFTLTVNPGSYVEVRTQTPSVLTLGQSTPVTVQLIPHNPIPPLRTFATIPVSSCYVPMDINARVWNDSQSDYSTTLPDATLSWTLDSYTCGILQPMTIPQEIDDGFDSQSIVASNATYMASYTTYITIVNGQTAKYRLDWNIPGVVPWADMIRYKVGFSRSRPLQLSGLDIRLEVTSQPYVGEVGYPMRFQILARNGIGGAAVANLVITGSINYNEWYIQQSGGGDSSSSGNDAPVLLITSDRLTARGDGSKVTPTLSADSGIAVTDKYGIATISMRMIEGYGGTDVYPFAFTSPSSAVGTPSTLVAISVTNPVSRIAFMTQPAASDGDAVQVKLADSGSLKSMIQPVVRVLGPSNSPVIGVTVDVYVIRNGLVQPDDWIRYTAVKTDANGIAAFTDVVFLDSSASSTYQLRFKTCGIYNDSNSFKVHNDLSIEEERLDMFKDITYAVMGLMVPLFMANSQYHAWWWAVLGFAVSIGYTSVGMYINLTQLAAQGDRKDVFGVLLRTLSIINLLMCTIGFAWLIIRHILVTYIHKMTYANDVEDRNAENTAFVARLLLRGQPRAAASSDKDKKATKVGIMEHIKQCWVNCCERPSGRDDAPPLDDMASPRSDALVKADYTVIEGKDNDKKSEEKRAVDDGAVMKRVSVKDMPYHDIKDFEGERIGFRYPQRLLFAISLTLVLLFISLLGCIVFLRWLASFIAKARAFLIGLQFRDDSLDISYIIEMSHQIYQDVSDSTSIGDFLKKGGATMGIVSMLLKMWNVSTNTVMLIGNIITAAGITGAILSYLFMSMSLWLILRNYKQFALALRHGDYAGVVTRTRRRNDIGIGNAAGLVGLMIWRFVLSFVSSFIFLFLLATIASMCWYIPAVWNYLFGKVQNIILGLSVTYIIVRVVLKLVGMYVIRGSSIAHRRLFALYDFVLLFIGFASGLLSAVSQFVTAMLMVFVNFPRVDLETYHGDAGFGSFLGMLRADHEFNSPVISRALHWLLHDARHIQHTEQFSSLTYDGDTNANGTKSLPPSSSGSDGGAGVRLQKLSGSRASVVNDHKTTSEPTNNVTKSVGDDVTSLTVRPSSVSVTRARALQRLRVLYTLTANPVLLYDEGLRK